MPKAENHTTRSRRAMLSLGAAALVAPAAALVANPDVELIRFADRVAAEAAAWRAMTGVPEAAMNAATVRIGRSLRRLAGMRPATSDGCRALARAACATAMRNPDGEVWAPEPAQELAWQVVAFTSQRD